MLTLLSNVPVISDNVLIAEQLIPLTVLLNVVSFSRLLPVLEAIQLFSVVLSVLENWADQIDIELSFFLVSGAISSNA
ncbi:hypothetical protein G9A89_018973 [Geosiphon pyriformis]|nr:hypothetical protein G9A89_018973 [Geosiphon pyriformis]